MQTTWKLTLCAAALTLAGCSGTGFGLSDPLNPPRGFERFFSPAPHAYRPALAEAGEPVRRGTRAERFELRDADCGGSDCGNPRARAELRQADESDYAAVGQDIWYGWSFRNGTIPSFARDNSLRLVFGQWTMGGEARPVMRLIQLGRDEGNWRNCDPAVCTGPSRASGDVVLQLEDMRDARGWGAAQNDGYVCRLFDMADAAEAWQDIVINTNFSSGPDGYLRVWVNGVPKCDYAGPLVSANSLAVGARVGHRHGIFASFTERWDDATGGAPRPTLVAYYDEFRIGQSHGEVDIRAQQAADLPPRS